MSNPQETIGDIQSIVSLTDSILKIVLKPKQYIPYQAGQFLQMYNDDHAFYYSIANAPCEQKNYELHIRHSLNQPFNQPLLAHVKRHRQVNIKLPFGKCDLNHISLTEPILFLAWGTGFSPIKAMIEALLKKQYAQPLGLIWSGKSITDFYMEDVVLNWKTSFSNFKYHTVVGESGKGDLANIAEQQFKDFKTYQIVLSGPFDLVYRVRDELLARGISAKQLFSDAFEFEGI